MKRRFGLDVAASRAGLLAWTLLLGRAFEWSDAFAAPKNHNYDIHILFSTECDQYFDWQSLGLVHSARVAYEKAGLPPPKITRLMACDEQPPPSEDIVPTHVHPNYAINPKNHDHYTAYNKPFSVMHFLEHGTPLSEWICVIDADMVIRSPISVENTGVGKGTPVAAHYGYLQAVGDDVYMAVKEEAKKVQKAPFQRVGGFIVYHVDDLKAVAPRWLYYTERVRTDKDSWANTGDIFNDNGKKGPPWISEMYGYVFGAAEAGMHHIVENRFMLYPGYASRLPEPYPLVVHYGLAWNMGDYAFDKHWFKNARLNMTACPGLLWPKPPTLDQIPYDQSSNPVDYARNKIMVQALQLLYDGLREHHIKVCGEEGKELRRHRYVCWTDSRQVHECHPSNKCPGDREGLVETNYEVLCPNDLPSLQCNAGFVAQFRSATVLCGEHVSPHIARNCSGKAENDGVNREYKQLIERFGKDVTTKLGRLSTRGQTEVFNRETAPSSLFKWREELEGMCEVPPSLLLEWVCLRSKEGMRYSWYFPAGERESPTPAGNVQECPTCQDKPGAGCCQHAKTYQCEVNPGWMLLKCPKTCGFCTCEDDSTLGTSALDAVSAAASGRYDGSLSRSAAGAIKGVSMTDDLKAQNAQKELALQLKQALNKRNDQAWIKDPDLEDETPIKSIAEAMQNMGLIWLLLLSVGSGMITCGIRRRRSHVRPKKKTRMLRFQPLDT